MLKKVIFILGILLLIASVFIHSNIVKIENQAVKKDGKKTAFGMISDETPMCSWSVKEPERAMSENKTQAIYIDITNPAKKPCLSYISLRSPNFELSPARDEQQINLPVHGKGSLSWIITPKKTGTFDMAVSDSLNTRIFGITVTNMFGFTAAQAKFFSFITGLCGPMLTVPWWVEKWFQRKGKKEPQKTENGKVN
jgi:hypothetical protein